MAATKAAVIKFNDILRKDVYPEVGDGETEDSQLLAAGRKLIGRGFMGVFASDEIPKFPTRGNGYCIVNVDDHTKPGSHWLAVAKHGGCVYFYDSFGRSVDQILPTLKQASTGQGLALMAKKSRPEQRRDQSDCGARSLAWLLLFKRFGPRVAKLVSE
jgi:hypothetical protein